ncbi:MAG: LUD domain-containing protein [Candidatus Korarchaeum sp.]
MSLLHSLTDLESTEGPRPRSNLELIDKVLSGELTGRLASFVRRRYATCPNSTLNLSELASNLARSKEEALSGLDSLLATACKELEENRMKCYVAETRDEARKIVGEIVGSGKLVLKSFSLTLEECGLGEQLAAAGNDVYDTEFPSAASELGEEIDLRAYREKLEKADFGITDVASLSVDPGALFLLPRSGIERLISMVPLKHIAVVGIDQLVRSYEEGFKYVELAMRLDRELSYAGVVGGPSKTGDIEKKVVYGAHGPKEVHVILLDDGRREALTRSPFREAISIPSLGKVPCHHLWPFWKAILRMDGSKELASSLLRNGDTKHLGIDLTHLLELL